MRFIFLLSVSLLASCSTMEGYSTFSGKDNLSHHPEMMITQKSNPKADNMYGNGKVKIDYETNESLSENTEKSIRNEMLSPKEAERLRANVPKGGRIIVHIFRGTVESASPRWFTYVLMKNGKEIARHVGEARVDNVARVPSRNGYDGHYWTNLDIVNINEKVTTDDKIELFVIDKLTDERDEFKLAKKEEEKKDRSISSSQN